MIELRQVEKAFFEGQNQRVLYESLNLQLGSGLFHAITGRSGSGKSTLLNMIAGIEPPDNGVIELDGKPVSSWSEPKRTSFRRKHIGTVFQFFHLLPLLTVEQNIQLPLELNGLMGKEHQDFSLELLDKVGLLERKSSYPDVLSGGEKQRVALVRALVHRPAYLLADEPTGNLDATSATNVLSQLRDLIHEQSCTVVMVTHSAEAAAYADNHIELDKII